MIQAFWVDVLGNQKIHFGQRQKRKIHCSEVSHGKQLRREERVYPPGNLEIVCFFVAHRVAAWCKLTTSNNLFVNSEDVIHHIYAAYFATAASGKCQ